MLFPDKLLVDRLEKNLALDMKAYVQSFNRLFPDYDAVCEEVGGGIAIYTGEQFINTTIGVGLDNATSITDLEKIEAFFSIRGLSSHIEICSLTDESFINLLNESNYRLTEFNTAYTCLLENRVAKKFDANNIRVEIVDDANRDMWVQTAMNIYQHDSMTDTRLAQAASNRELTTCFLAQMNGEAVGASALSIRDGIATLYFTATRYAYRNHGIQTAMLQTRLDYAQAQGCEIAFSTTIPGNNSMRNLMRAGFQVAYVRCEMKKHAHKDSHGVI